MESLQRSLATLAILLVGAVAGCAPPGDSRCSEHAYYVDADGDGFGEAGGQALSEEQCLRRAEDGSLDYGYVSGDSSDCDDGDPAIHPAADEVCDGVDDDCDGAVDDADPDLDRSTASTWYADADADAYGDASVSAVACEPPSGFVADATDCDDDDATVSPSAAETCDGVDNDCDGTADDGLEFSTRYLDADGDGFGDLDRPLTDCEHPSDYVRDATDCDDGDPAIHPAADEVCDGVDDGAVDDADPDLDRSTASTWYADADADAYGDASVSAVACEPPSGFVADATDCDDDDAWVHPAATELCRNGIDDDCDSSTADECLAGGTLDLSAADAKIVGEGAGDRAGWAVAAAGDVDGDGFDDLLIGAYLDDSHGTTSGAAYLVHGPLSGTLDLSAADAKLGATDTQHLGKAVAGAGDTNGDGFSDLLLGAPLQNTGGIFAGAAYLVLGPVSGPTDLSTAQAWLVGEDAYDYAGFSVSSGGDLDGDGLADLVIGAYGDDDGGSSAGAAYLVSGTTSGTSSLSSARAKLVGEAASDFAGYAVAGAGDVDGDGLGDVLVGAPFESTSASLAGAAYLVLGPVSGTLDLSAADARFEGEATWDQAGHAVAGAGDVDGDGLDDILVGAYGDDDGGSDAGAAYLLLAPLSGSVGLGSADAKFLGASASDAAGASVSGTGDVDGDGVTDLLIGASGASDGGMSAGATYLVLGPASGTASLSAADAVLVGEAASDYAGLSAVGAGDVDGDGLDDILVGAWGDDSGGSAAGAAYLVLGGSL